MSKQMRVYTIDLRPVTRTANKVVIHVKANKEIYFRVGGVLVSVLIFHSGSGFTGNGLDYKAYKLYKKLIRIGKWIIVFKGGWETISSVLSGDMAESKKQFLMYTLIYVILLGLPFALDQAEQVFGEFETEFTLPENMSKEEIDALLNRIENLKGVQ